ncbi:MAG: helix-hairpin-helix domain-containing protein [Gemmatimonadaceae bacterium]|nr:helix-hairpin-helix domain-containing protein [Gemmatimonadaceae bacterium]
MHPRKVSRTSLRRFEDLPNIGPAMAGDFVALGYTTPLQLTGADPYALYQRLCALTNTRQDPCVLDVFMSVTRFLDGEEPRAWWDFTAERKQRYGI